jgi:hypothetical protein
MSISNSSSVKPLAAMRASASEIPPNCLLLGRGQFGGVSHKDFAGNFLFDRDSSPRTLLAAPKYRESATSVPSPFDQQILRRPLFVLSSVVGY